MYMRLSSFEKNSIKEIITKFDPDAQIFLFGSRVDDTSKGGDIDLLLITKRNSFIDKLKLKVQIKEKIGEQRIDIVLTSNVEDSFSSLIYPQAVLI